MSEIGIRDVVDEDALRLVPPCADPSFDHRTCDYWEDAARGSKARRPSWLAGLDEAPASAPDDTRPGSGAIPGNPFAPGDAGAANPFAPPRRDVPNPFAPQSVAPAFNPFAVGDELAANPFAPRRAARPVVAAEAPRKLQLLGRGLAVFGSYAKVLTEDGEPAAYCQFGPLSAYPRALRLRELYPQLPDAPLPAVITCIATTAAARRRGLALRLVGAVCGDLAGRGFSAIEAYPEAGARPDQTSAASVAFWIAGGFRLAVDDERFPVVRRELE